MKKSISSALVILTIFTGGAYSHAQEYNPIPAESCVKTVVEGVALVRGNGFTKFTAGMINCSGQKVIISEPGVLIGTSLAIIDGSSDPDGACLALGLSAPGKLSSISMYDARLGGPWGIVKFNKDGKLESAKREDASSSKTKVVSVLECRQNHAK